MMYQANLLWVALEAHPLLERLVAASVELALFGLLVATIVRLGAFRSSRQVSILWLIVLLKPVLSLSAGSPVAIDLLGAAPRSASDATASAPPAPAGCATAVRSGGAATSRTLDHDL